MRAETNLQLVEVASLFKYVFPFSGNQVSKGEHTAHVVFAFLVSAWDKNTERTSRKRSLFLSLSLNKWKCSSVLSSDQKYFDQEMLIVCWPINNAQGANNIFLPEILRILECLVFDQLARDQKVAKHSNSSNNMIWSKVYENLLLRKETMFEVLDKETKQCMRIIPSQH